MIDQGIPIPKAKQAHKGYTAILRALKKNESVLLPTTINAASGLIAQMGVRKGTFVCRTQQPGNQVRVWRVK